MAFLDMQKWGTRRRLQAVIHTPKFILAMGGSQPKRKPEHERFKNVLQTYLPTSKSPINPNPIMQVYPRRLQGEWIHKRSHRGDFRARRCDMTWLWMDTQKEA